MKTLYLVVVFSAVIVPFLFSFHPNIKFHKTFKAFFLSVSIVGIVFIVWDMIFTQLGVWNFNPRYVTGFNIYNLPVEEVLFFIFIPFSCVFTYFCLNKFYNLSWPEKIENAFCIFLSAALLIVGIIFYDRLYTSVTFISTALVCLWLKFIAKAQWFGNAITVFGILLLPFFIVNGILTGTGPDEAVVRYNNEENLGIRLLTIPIEDTFYGLELILLNIFFYKKMQGNLK